MKKIILLLPLLSSLCEGMHLRASVRDSKSSSAVIISEKQAEPNVLPSPVATMRSAINPVNVNKRGVVESSVSDFIDSAAVIIDQCCGCLRKHKQLLLGKEKLTISNVTKEQINGFCKNPQGLFDSVKDKPLVYSKVNEILMSALSGNEKLEQLKALLKSGKSRGIKKRPDLGIENIFAFYGRYVTRDN